MDVPGGVYRVNRRAVVLAKPGRIDLAAEDGGRAVRSGSLRSVPLFSRLGDAELATLAGRFKESRHKAGEVIQEEGSSGRSLVIVADGTVELRNRFTGETREIRIDVDPDLHWNVDGEVLDLGDVTARPLGPVEIFLPTPGAGTAP